MNTMRTCTYRIDSETRIEVRADTIALFTLADAIDLDFGDTPRATWRRIARNAARTIRRTVTGRVTPEDMELALHRATARERR